MWREEAGFLTTADSELENQQRGHQDEQRLATVRNGQEKSSAGHFDWTNSGSFTLVPHFKHRTL